MIGARLKQPISEIDKDIAKGKNVPSVLEGYETPESRPAQDETYVMMMNALGRLTQAKGINSANIKIQEMIAYFDAFEPPCRLGWFIDAIQMIERIRLEMSDG